MSTSGSVDFSVTRNDLLEDALREIGAVGRGMAPTGDQMQYAARRLNMIVKQWQGQADFAPGLKVWTRKRGVIFLEKDKASYQLGTDQATVSYNETTCKVAAVATGTTIDVNAASPIADGNYIVIVMDDGNVHTTTVNGTPAGDTVTLTDQLTAAVSVGNKIWSYTAKMQRPEAILAMYRRNSSGEDTPITPMTLADYERLGDKDASGTPSRYYFEQERSDGTVYFDMAVEDVTDVIHITFLRPIEDFDAADDEPDYPQRWYRALLLQTAVDIAPYFGKPVSQDTRANLIEAIAVAQNDNPETSDIFFERDR